MKRKLLLSVFIILFAFTFLPFLVPVKPLPDTAPVENLISEPSQLIELEDFTAHVRVMGAGEQTLVLLHGMGSTLHTWDDVQSVLAQTAQVVAVDLPGYGLTRPKEQNRSASRYSISGRAEFVIDLMDTAGIDRAVLIGNSAGGKLAAYLAANFPERVQALVLVDPAIFGGGIPPFISPVLHTPQMDHLGPLFARLFIKQWISLLETNRYVSEENLDSWRVKYKRPQLAQGWDVELWKQIQYSPGVLVQDVLRLIHTPTLVLQGEADQLVPQADSLKVNSLIVGSKFIIVPDSAHLPQEENPVELIRLIQDFLN